MKPDWRIEFLRLSIANKNEQAAALAQEAANEGILEAKVMLARTWASLGRPKALVDAAIVEVERQVSKDDALTHLELYRAYDCLLGPGDFEHKIRRALQHLEAGALASPNPIHKLAYARVLRDGNAVLQPDGEAAIKWFRLAAADGSDEAKQELRRLQGRG
jgi:TPR repeat protein